MGHWLDADLEADCRGDGVAYKGGVERASSATGEPGNPFALIILLFGSTISALAFVTVTPGLPSIADYFARAGGDNTLRAQFVLTMAPIGMAFGGLFGGWLTSRIGLRRALFAGLVGCGIFGMAPLYLDHLYAIYAVRLLLGWSAVTVDVCMTTILSARFEGDRRAKLIGIKQAVGSSFTFGGMIVSGLLVQAFSWRAPFWIFAIAFLYLAIAASVFRAPISQSRRAPADWAVIAGFWPLYAAVVLLAVAHTMPHFELPFLLEADGMKNAAEISWFPATSALISILSAASFGWIHARAGRWTLVAALILMGTSLAAIGVAPTLALLFASVVVEGFGGGLMLPFLSNRVLEKAPMEQRSQAFGLLLSIMFVGQFFNPLVNKPLRDFFGIHDAFVAVGGALVAVALALALAGRRPVMVRPADL